MSNVWELARAREMCNVVGKWLIALAGDGIETYVRSLRGRTRRTIYGAFPRGRNSGCCYIPRPASRILFPSNRKPDLTFFRSAEVLSRSARRRVVVSRRATRSSSSRDHLLEDLRETSVERRLRFCIVVRVKTNRARGVSCETHCDINPF